MEAIIKLKKLELNGTVVMWDKNDAGIIKYAGSVYFENMNYRGFMNHNSTVELYRNNKIIGNFKPENFIIA